MQVLGDLRYALRTLRRSPGYALTCIAVLALGIGANAAIFSVIYSVVLKSLPYPDPSRLVFVWERYPNMPDPPGSRIPARHKSYLEWQRQNTVFSDMAALRDNVVNETGSGEPEQVDGGYASANLFSMLGAHARIGRLFSAAEDRKGSDHVVVLSDAYFERRFHGDSAALGRTLTLGGANYTVIGVLPREFHLPATWRGLDQKKPDVWVPLSVLWNTPADEEQHELLVPARLKPGVSLTQARAEMAAIEQRIVETDSTLRKGWTASVYPFAVEDASPTLDRALYILLGAVGFLLLIACANLANLTLARATLRSRELSVRLALGATRGGLIRQLLAESLLVSFAGAAAGLLLAYWCIRLMVALKPADIQRPELISVDPGVFAFGAAVAVLTTLLFGLAPSIAASRVDLNSALKSGGGWRGSAARLRSRQFLIAAEVALALVLVSGAGLLIRSFHELVSSGVGFNTEHLTTLDLSLPQQRYPDDASRSRFFHSLLDRVRAIPGVSLATVIDNQPLHRITLVNFYIAGEPEPPSDSLPLADVGHVDPQFFSALQLRLRAGRLFTDADLAQGEKGGDTVAIVNEAFVKKFLAGRNAVGKRLLDPGKQHASEIVGVVSDYNTMGADAEARPQVFWPNLKLAGATLIVRTRGAEDAYTHAIQAAVWSLDKDLPADKVQSMDSYLDDLLAQHKFNATLLGAFAGLALALAMIGIYSVLANLVSSRVREIGIRMAIGASPREVGRLILRQSMLPVAVGLVFGLAGTLALSRFLDALLFRVQSHDPLTLGAAMAAILLISPAALYVPLRRATRVDCTVALREE